MAKSEQQMPEPNRPDSEIEFVLRNAKQRRGPEVLRDLSRAGAAEQAPAPRNLAAGKARTKAR